MDGIRQYESRWTTKSRRADSLLPALGAVLALFVAASCNSRSVKQPVQSRLATGLGQSTKFETLGKERAQVERADLEKNGGIILDLLACGPVVLYPVGECKEIVIFVSPSGDKDDGGFIVLSRLIGGKPTRIFKAKLTALRRNSEHLKGTINSYLAGQGWQIANNAPKASRDYTLRVTKGFASYQAVYSIGTINCQVIYPDGNVSNTEEMDAEGFAKGGYPVSNMEARLLQPSLR